MLKKSVSQTEKVRVALQSGKRIWPSELKREATRRLREVEDLNAEVAAQTARTVEFLHEQYSPKSETVKAKRRQGAMRADDQRVESDPALSRRLKSYAVVPPPNLVTGMVVARRIGMTWSAS
ncbi:hypothetical protein RPE78_17480 (plasmid) [Thioclava litoralis]|uniref:Transposase n=1 Tax=Thioclava litoralis TaxID=3076557 RepID=A0ABZ1E3P2_9RHOB|nr:hypothetical protein RPE78_17480 [Thioclava sp. FTW29]